MNNYLAVIHEDAEGGFWAEVPALPGCYTQAESIDELRANLREAISGVLAVLEEQGGRPEANIQVLDIAVEAHHGTGTPSGCSKRMAGSPNEGSVNSFV